MKLDRIQIPWNKKWCNWCTRCWRKCAPHFNHLWVGVLKNLHKKKKKNLDEKKEKKNLSISKVNSKPKSSLAALLKPNLVYPIPTPMVTLLLEQWIHCWKCWTCHDTRVKPHCNTPVQGQVQHTCLLNKELALKIPCSNNTYSWIF